MTQSEKDVEFAQHTVAQLQAGQPVELPEPDPASLWSICR
jgi:hypothetical protein